MKEPSFESLSAELLPVLQSLEEKRKQLKAKGSKQGGWVGLIILVIATATILLAGFEWPGWVITAFLIIVSYSKMVSRQSEELSVFYKEEVITKIIHLFCDNAVFSPYGGISQNVFQSTLLFTNPDYYHSEDLIEGRIDKTDFLCAEVHAKEKRTRKTKHGTQTYWVNIFQGFFFVADFHKDFQGVTILQRNSFIKSGSIGSRVKLESLVFEKQFDVYSTDQVEARYLITPSMMERLLELTSKLNKDIKICFRDSQVIIAIPYSGKHFEASVWRSVNNMKRIEKEFETIRSLLSIVEELNLNTRIWSKS